MRRFVNTKTVGRVLLAVAVVLFAVPASASFENERSTSLNESGADGTGPGFLPERPRPRPPMRDHATADRNRPDDVRGGLKGLERPDGASSERLDRARPARPDVLRPERPERPPARDVEPPERSPVDVPRGVRPDRSQVG